jgi:hypothetical protein
MIIILYGRRTHKFAEQCCFEIVFSFNFYISDAIFREKEACFHILDWSIKMTREAEAIFV